ncbi:MAG: PAS domain-containing protein [candidate division Zixibacteria bacterium]|nr:PAS domain-containing protein [candidate division Zixibacteria bacterium]
MTSRKPATIIALKIALPYLFISLTWILLSDRSVASLTSDIDTLTALQTYKGWFYITMSALIIYLTAQYYVTRLSRTQELIHDRELALSETQHAVFTLLANLPGMAYRGSYDERRQMDFVSEGCLNLTGYESSQLVGPTAAPYAQLIIEEDRDMVRHEISRALRDQKPFQVEYRIRTRSGGTKWVSEQGCGIPSASEGAKVLVGYIFDVERSDLRRTRSQSAERERSDPAKTLDPDQSVSQGLNILSRNL